MVLQRDRPNPIWGSDRPTQTRERLDRWQVAEQRRGRKRSLASDAPGISCRRAARDRDPRKRDASHRGRGVRRGVARLGSVEHGVRARAGERCGDRDSRGETARAQDVHGEEKCRGGTGSRRDRFVAGFVAGNGAALLCRRVLFRGENSGGARRSRRDRPFVVGRDSRGSVDVPHGARRSRGDEAARRSLCGHRDPGKRSGLPARKGGVARQGLLQGSGQRGSRASLRGRRIRRYEVEGNRRPGSLAGARSRDQRRGLVSPRVRGEARRSEDRLRARARPRRRLRRDVRERKEGRRHRLRQSGRVANAAPLPSSRSRSQAGTQRRRRARLRSFRRRRLSRRAERASGVSDRSRRGRAPARRSLALPGRVERAVPERAARQGTATACRSEQSKFTRRALRRDDRAARSLRTARGDLVPGRIERRTRRGIPGAPADAHRRLARALPRTIFRSTSFSSRTFSREPARPRKARGPSSATRRRRSRRAFRARGSPSPSTSETGPTSTRRTSATSANGSPASRSPKPTKSPSSFRAPSSNR